MLSSKALRGAAAVPLRAAPRRAAPRPACYVPDYSAPDPAKPRKRPAPPARAPAPEAEEEVVLVAPVATDGGVIVIEAPAAE